MAEEVVELAFEGVDKLIDKHFETGWDKSKALKQKAPPLPWNRKKNQSRDAGAGSPDESRRRSGGDSRRRSGEDSRRRSGGSGRRDGTRPSQDKGDAGPASPPSRPPNDPMDRRDTTAGEFPSKRSSRRPREDDGSGDMDRRRSAPEDRRAKRMQSSPTDGPPPRPSAPSSRLRRGERDRDRDRARDSRHGSGSGSAQYPSPRSGQRQDHQSSGSRPSDYEQMGQMRSSRIAPQFSNSIDDMV